MRFLRTTSTARLLALVIGVAVVAAATAAIAIAATGSSGQKPPPKPLAQALHDALTGPKVNGVTARIKFTNHLVDSSAVVGANPLVSGASGRLWASSDGKVRLELQSTNGDVQVTSDGKSFLVYDSGSNTAYRGEIPQGQSQDKPDAGPPSVSKIQKSIGQARQHGSVSGAIPTTVAGRSAYEVRVVPQHGGLLSGARLAWDALRGVPLRVAVYARGNASPVLSLSAQHISFGKVAASTFAISPPKGAHVVDLTPHSGGPSAAHGKDVTGLSAVQKAVGFSVSAPDQLAGKNRQDVRQVGQNGALVTYGQGLDGLAVFEQKADSQTQSPAPTQHGDNGLALPTVSINGTTGQELPTALGTVVRFERGGVEYTVLGSQPSNTVIAAARAL